MSEYGIALLIVLQSVLIHSQCHLCLEACCQTFELGQQPNVALFCCCCSGWWALGQLFSCWQWLWLRCGCWSGVRRVRVGTITGGNVGAGDGWLFLPVNILTVFCIKSVFGLLDPAASGRFIDDADDADIEWQRTTSGALPPDQSVLLPKLLPPMEPSRPAELDLYGGGDSDSKAVRFGGGLIHFWYISDSCNEDKRGISGRVGGQRV